MSCDRREFLTHAASAALTLCAGSSAAAQLRSVAARSDVAWLPEVLEPPADATPPSRPLAPILADGRGGKIATVAAWEPRRTALDGLWRTVLGRMDVDRTRAPRLDVITEERVGGIDESIAGAEDYDLCLRLSEQTEIRKLARPLYFYRVHDRSISSEKRLWQIMQSKEAVNRALRRRGMDGEFEIDVELVGRFRLRKKNA